MTSITFTAYGTPEPKGSTRSFVATSAGGKPRAVTTSDNPSLKRWEALVRFEAQMALRRAGETAAPFFEGPVAIRIRFGFMRPRSVSAKRRPLPTVKPDLDKLVRAAIDPLIGVLMRDDTQVVQLLNCEKVYVADGRPAFCELTVMAVDAVVRS